MTTTTSVVTVSIHDLAVAWRRRRAVCVLLIAVPVVLVALWYAVVPRSYTASVLLDVTRTGTAQQPSDAYAYDDYYRLEADKAFATTVEQWLRTPRVAEDVLGAAGMPIPDDLRDRERFFAAHRVSGSSVTVEYRVARAADATRIATALAATLTDRAAALDTRQGTVQRLGVQLSDPVVTVTGPSRVTALVLAVVFGAVLAGGAVLHGALRRRS